MKKIKACLLIPTLLTGFTGIAEANNVLPLSPSVISFIDNDLGVNVNVSNLSNAILNVLSIDKSLSSYNRFQDYTSSSVSGSINGHTVTISTADGSALGNLSIPHNSVTIHSQLVNFVSRNTSTPDALIVKVDGNTIVNGSQVTMANIIELAQSLNILPFIEAATSTSLASFSPSSVSSQMAYNQLNGGFLSIKEKQANEARQTENVNFAMGDLQYENAGYSNNGSKGNIVGATMAVSTNVSGVELGARVPYSYLSFSSFTANRTGTMLYAKRNWDLPSHLQLTTMVDFNYLATYVSQLSLTNTYGGGFGTALTYDNNGVWVPRISFALQYNQDDYGQANYLMVDNHQSLKIMEAER